eukprot:CFRG3373T1
MRLALLTSAFTLLIGAHCSTLRLESSELLSQPSEFISSNGRLDATITITAKKVIAPFGLSFNTRLYNGRFPGPSFRCRAGDVISLRIVNELGENNALAENRAKNNELHHPNSTNVHLHGLHISPTGNQDNINVNIAPGQTFQYEYKILETVGAGTSYFHPHLHGSTHLQVFGLMVGAFIVEDDPDKTSPELLEMDDFVVVIQSIYMERKDKFFETYAHNETSDMPVALENPEKIERNLLLVNGQYIPRVELSTGEIKRLRVINGLPMAAVMFGMRDTKDCQLFELAYDGTYLLSPRQTKTIFVPSGGRADIAVRCLAPGIFYLSTVRDERLDNYSQIWTPLTGKHHVNNTQAMLELAVNSNEKTMKLPSTLPPLPKYLQDLRDRSEDVNAEWETSFAVQLSNANGEKVINNQAYNESAPLGAIRINSFNQWLLSAGEPRDEKNIFPQHPYHQHVNPFLITSDDPVTGGILFRKGDFRDTVALYNITPVNVRFYAADFVGPMMIHCHNLIHEDKGMMGVVTIEE